MRSMQNLRALALTMLVSTALAMSACTPTRTQKSVGERIDDTVVTTRVKTALIGNPATKARQIDVEVFRGAVQLNGFVDSAAERREAERIARDVDGVASVRNNLQVRPSGAATVGEVVDDIALAARVKAALAGSAETNAFQVNVATSNGVVQLSGFVNSAASKSAATEVARSVDGVKSVRNELEIK